MYTWTVPARAMSAAGMVVLIAVLEPPNEDVIRPRRRAVEADEVGSESRKPVKFPVRFRVSAGPPTVTKLGEIEVITGATVSKATVEIKPGLVAI